MSRLADLCLAVALALVHARVGSFELARIAVSVEAQPALPASMHVAAVLFVLAVALRSAQLPFHGWITQVMEAPTPVSALLHAGVVNIGGFVLLRLAPWLARAGEARLLAVVIGLGSTVVAALVMSTRVSVKVALAWSTCAQMGFMLVECGLGLFSLALLHLVAHSLYKAHAFLAAGSAVEEWRLGAMAPAAPPVTAGRLAVATLLALGTSFGAMRLAAMAGVAPEGTRGQTAFAVLVGLAMVPLLARADAVGAGGTALRVLGFVGLSVLAHFGAARIVPSPAATTSAATWGLVAAGFVGLFAVKSALELRPHGRLARALHPWLFAGLYLDELFTRLTFRVWPPRLPATVEPSATHCRLPVAVEARS